MPAESTTPTLKPGQIQLDFNIPQLTRTAVYLSGILGKSYERMLQKGDLNEFWNNPKLFSEIAMFGADPNRRHKMSANTTVSGEILEALASGRRCELLSIDLLRLLNANMMILDECLDARMKDSLKKGAEERIPFGFGPPGGTPQS